MHGENPDIVRERALNLLARVGLAEKANEYPKRLSGGQQQHVDCTRPLHQTGSPPF